MRRPVSASSEIFNTDQCSQFTSNAFTGVPRAAEIKINMDGRGRWMDNVFIERLWRFLKYECVYLHAFEIISVRPSRAHSVRYVRHFGASTATFMSLRPYSFDVSSWDKLGDSDVEPAPVRNRLVVVTIRRAAVR